MILDKVFIKVLNRIGKDTIENKLLKERPENIDDLFELFSSIRNGIENNEKQFGMVGYILYNFISSEEVRKRKVTSRIVENMLASFFDGEVRDEISKENPNIIDEIKKLDFLCNDETWKISEDLAGNKREKDDIKICDYTISIKTLVGETYNITGHCSTKKGLNSELNIGSVSFRALLKGILIDEDLKKLSDRKGGLGSKSQLKKYLFDKLDEERKEQFISRVELFFSYLYTDDFLILLKENFRIRVILFTSKDFRTALKKAWDKNLDEFLSIFYRWENNNLRIMWIKLLPYLENSKEVILPLHKVYIDFKIDLFIEKIKEKNLEEVLEYLN